ncbi:hypothetical protein [Phormidesmis sp. 146-33]
MRLQRSDRFKQCDNKAGKRSLKPSSGVVDRMILQNSVSRRKIKTQFIDRGDMLKTPWATVREGKIELLDLTELPEGTRLLVTLLPDDEADFWMRSSQASLDAVWDNAEDEVYAQLLQK